MAGVSALLKSAQATASAVNDYNDSLAAYQYENSGYTDDAFQAYSDYLNQRMSTLNDSTSISDASKFLTLTKALDTATKSNISATITRENIQVLAGNASPTDKYNAIVAQYTRASNNGDLTLAQSLESQAYSLSQTIQEQAQASAQAATTLASTTASQTAANAAQNAQDAMESLKDLNAQWGNAGYSASSTVVKNWVAQNSAFLAQQGVVIPKNAQPNYFDLVQGVQGYLYNMYTTAAQALQATNPDSAQDYLNKAQDIASGTTKVSTLMGDMSAQDVLDAANNPNEFKFDPSQGKFVKTDITGVNANRFVTQDPNADPNSPDYLSKTSIQVGIEPSYSGSIIQVVPPQINIALKGLGLNYNTNSNGTATPVSTTNNGIEVEVGKYTDPTIKAIIQKGGGVTTAYWNPSLNNPNDESLPNAAKGGLQFQSSSSGRSLSGQSVYSVVYDKNGNKQVYESDGYEDKLISTDPNYNDGSVQTSKPSFLGGIGNDLKSGIRDIGGLLSGTASADNLPSHLQPQYTGNLLQMAQLKQEQIQAQQQRAANIANLPSLAPGVPQIQAAPTPAIQAAPIPLQAPPVSIQAKPTNVQGSTTSPQNISNKATISTKQPTNNSTISF